jgi:hypothetical protein
MKFLDIGVGQFDDSGDREVFITVLNDDGTKTPRKLSDLLKERSEPETPKRLHPMY